MKRIPAATLLCVLFLLSCLGLSGCRTNADEPTVGVAFGVGAAERWPQEIKYMQDYAEQNNIPLKTRYNTDEQAKPFKKDCLELIDSGIDVLILRARDPFNMKDVLDYAKSKGVKIVSYSGIIMNDKVDLFVGHDCENIGAKLGEYLVENVPQGDYILLAGDPTDKNVSEPVRKGALKHLSLLPGNINLILDAHIPDWSMAEAKRLVTTAIRNNGGRVDAILAPNDKIAGVCIETLRELGITTPVAIAAMDGELDAVRRIVAGTQSCTFYMDLKLLAHTAMEQAVNLAKGWDVTVNAERDNNSGSPILCNLISGQLVTKHTVDSVLIDSNYYTREQVYQTGK